MATHSPLRAGINNAEVWICEHVAVYAQRDSHLRGLIGPVQTQLDKCDYIRGTSYRDLLQALGSRYSIPVNEGTVVIEKGGHGQFRIVVTITETLIGCEPSAGDLERWRNNEADLLNVEYVFTCYKARLDPIAEGEFAYAS